MNIRVEPNSQAEWLVTVDAKTITKHRVRVTDADLQRFGGESAAHLLSASFRFLLDREPNTSILPSFHLPVISRYFPEFETEIRRYIVSQKEP